MGEFGRAEGHGYEGLLGNRRYNPRLLRILGN